MTHQEFVAALEDNERCIKRWKFFRENPHLVADAVQEALLKGVYIPAFEPSENETRSAVSRAVDKAIDTLMEPRNANKNAV